MPDSGKHEEQFNEDRTKWKNTGDEGTAEVINKRQRELYDPNSPQKFIHSFTLVSDSYTTAVQALVAESYLFVQDVGMVAFYIQSNTPNKPEEVKCQTTDITMKSS